MARLELYRPLKPLVISQHFGENMACINDAGNVTATSNTCPPGYFKLYPAVGLKGHNGLDLPARGGTPIYNTQEGYVKELSFDKERGLGVGVITSTRYVTTWGEWHIKLRYWHLLSISVQPNQFVGIGDIIGYVDNTGLSSSDHLHFEVKPVEINAPSVEQATSHTNVLQQNGYFGAIDPEPYLSGLYAVDVKPVIFKLRSIIAQLVSRVAELTRPKP
jgi:murein DD-endopeptidase MepM/ murein hydrolase activator NlpD